MDADGTFSTEGEDTTVSVVGLADTNRVCADCGVVFVIGSDEAGWYEDRGWTVPRRCAACRRTRRAERRADDEYRPRR